MDKEKFSMQDLEKEIAYVEGNAKAEEENNARYNYGVLEKEIKQATSNLPYPQVHPYDLGSDYEEVEKIKFQKDSNQPFWKIINETTKYFDCAQLYVGHVNLNDQDYFIMENPLLDSKVLENEPHKIQLVDVDDKKYRDIVRAWRYPGDNQTVKYSRNIIMKDKNIKDVDVRLDRTNNSYKDITDAFLRKALLRNKNNEGIRSIVRTIQKKQDDIRLLPKNKSFIVQGCAGSGKTMVLLHRLRYLIRNKDIEYDDYIFLEPGNQYKEFISSLAKEFKINDKNIMSYKEYYQYLMGKKNVISEEADESVFPEKYLTRVYSERFLRECYQEILEIFSDQTRQLIEFCDSELSKQIQVEKDKILVNIELLRKSTLEFVQDKMKKIMEHTSHQLKIYEDLPGFIAEVEEIKNENEKKSKHLLESIDNINIAPNDERIKNNIRLNTLKNEIEEETIAVQKASFFTVGSHKRKLTKLMEKYDEAYDEELAEVIEQEKQRLMDLAAQEASVFEGVTLVSLNENLLKAHELISQTDSELKVKIRELDFVHETIQRKNSQFIDLLQHMIEIDYDDSRLYKLLLPCYAELKDTIVTGQKLLVTLNSLTKETKSIQEYKEKFKFFLPRTEKQSEAYLAQRLFNTCRKNIRKEFQISICDKYKHYWYLALFCQYLTKEQSIVPRQYIYIDEAQDLSTTELELISKMNSGYKGSEKFTPTINMFGDVNQMITGHGVADWNNLKSNYEVITLNENFRNTNQIVDYCNRELPFKMKKVGVDSEEISIYKNLQEAHKAGFPDNAKLIVKDEYSVLDLQAILDELGIKNVTVFTVKAVKGLEFKEVYIFDDGMSANEKYIAYTRALVKLNVIKELPQTYDRSDLLIEQGHDDMEIQNI